VGGQNIDYDSLRYPADAGCIDAMAEFASPGAVTALRDSFLASWNAYSVERVDPADFPVPAAEGPMTAEVRIVNQGPPRSDFRVTAMFDALFATAREELWLVQCYAFLTPALLDRIERAEAKGVQVKVVLSSGHIAPRFVHGSYYGIKDLLEAGAEVFIFESPGNNLLHYKMAMADGAVASIGSANFNLRSQTTSREAAVLVYDPESMEIVRARFEELKPCLRPVDLAEAERYRSPAYFLDFLLMQVAG